MGAFRTYHFFNYFGIANTYQVCVDLDLWIRRRVSNLMRLGVHVQAAAVCGITSKGTSFVILSGSPVKTHIEGVVGAES
jgi:hypothetical protein